MGVGGIDNTAVPMLLLVSRKWNQPGCSRRSLEALMESGSSGSKQEVEKQSRPTKTAGDETQRKTHGFGLGLFTADMETLNHDGVGIPHSHQLKMEVNHNPVSKNSQG